MKYKAEIKILQHTGLLDPRSNTVEATLRGLEYDMLEHIRIGKYMVIEVNCENKTLAEKSIRDMCEKLLVNSLMEKYTITFIDDTIDSRTTLKVHKATTASFVRHVYGDSI
jgi:phosphoribosylformylglycinamidine synthase